MKLLTQTLALGALALAPSCSGLAVETDYDPEVDFSARTRYAWLDAEAPQMAELVQGDLLVQRVVAAADPVLAAAGMQLTDPDEAALWLRTSVVTRDRIEAWSTSYGAGYGYGHPWWSGVPVYTDTTLAIYPETLLILDFVLPEEERLVWRGIGELDTHRADTPEERAARVAETVSAILAEFPPGRSE